MDTNALAARIGTVVGRSDWIEVTQATIDTFATATGDTQFIHTDPDRARAGPFGGTVAHGFLTLSLLSAMLEQAGPPVTDAAVSVNYGFDRMRFVSPVRAGARVRGVFTLTAVVPRGADAVDTTFDVSVEIEGQDRPALVAVWINRHLASS